MTSLLVASAALGMIQIDPSSLAAPRSPTTSAAEPDTPFATDTLYWLEVRAEDFVLAEAIDAYLDPTGLYLPLGELSRLLDLAVVAHPDDGRAEGWILTRERILSLDLNAGEAILGLQRIAFAPDQAVAFNRDIYLRQDLLEQLLPVRLRPDPSGQRLVITPLEPLPLHARRQRHQTRLGLATVPATDSETRELPYELFTAPAVDVGIGGQMTRDGTAQSRRFDVRLAGDFAFAGLQAYLGSDDSGNLRETRVTLDRRDPNGRALGPLGGVQAAAGDVFSPSAALGAASRGGRGFVYSTAPFESLDLATPLDLRGELALGEEVELYVNDVLQASRASSDQGRYAFLNVPLTAGPNTIRLVFYGARGERREEVRRITLGTGQLTPGQVVVRLGAVQQDRYMASSRAGWDDASVGAWRIAALFDVGVTPQLTASGGVVRYAPPGLPGRTLGLAGLRGGWAGMALQGDLALDDVGGRAIALSAAGLNAGATWRLRHAEFQDGFIDETRQYGWAGAARLSRATDLRADLAPALGRRGEVPVSIDLSRLEWAGGDVALRAQARASAPLGAYYASAALAWQDDTRMPDRLWGSVDIATLVSSRLQLRAGLAVAIRPEPELDNAFVSAELTLDDRHSFRAGVVHRPGAQGGAAFEASHLYRTPWFDLGGQAGYDAGSGEWRLGIQLAFGLAFDPVRRRYTAVRPGAATTGAVLFDAYLDDNGDGVRQPVEAGVEGLRVQGPSGTAVTGPQGHATLRGLSDALPARLRPSLESVEAPFLAAGGAAPTPVRARAGRLARVDYPVQRTGEVEVTALFRRADAGHPLSALDLELEPVDGGPPRPGRTDHDGIAVFADIPAGTYVLRIAPAQAQTLGLALTARPEVVVPPHGGFVRVAPVHVIPARDPS